MRSIYFIPDSNEIVFVLLQLRRRIKLEHITVNILDDIKINYSHILEKHINTLMHLLHDFMREKNRIVADFAKAAYR